MLLVVLDTLVEFDAFVALKFQTLTVSIYAQYQLSFSASGAAALALLSIVACVIVLFGESWLRGGANYTRISQGARRGIVRYRAGRGGCRSRWSADRATSRSAWGSRWSGSSTGSHRARGRPGRPRLRVRAVVGDC